MNLPLYGLTDFDIFAIAFCAFVGAAIIGAVAASVLEFVNRNA